MRRIHRTVWSVLGLGLLATTGCARKVPTEVTQAVEADKCELVHAAMKAPAPARLAQEITSQGREEPTPVVVYVRHPEQSMLERFFSDERPQCGDGTFRVVQDSVVDAVVLYLQEVQGGYVYDARRSSLAQLSMDGRPQGTLKREGASWVSEN